MKPTIDDVLAGRAQWCVLQGDNAKLLPTLPEKAVDHVITDPPYEAAAHTKQRRINRDMVAARNGGGRQVEVEALSFAPISEAERGLVAAQFGRITKRWCIAFCQVEAAVKWSDVLGGAQLRTQRIGVWVKPDGMPQFTGDRPGMGYETLVFAHAKGRSRWNGGGRTGVFTHNKGGDERTGHQTQKPVSLMRELVELFTDPGDVVLDPFCGSGTTGLACLQLGRRFIGFEFNEEYSRIANDRLAAEGRGLSLRDARAGQTSIFDLVAP